MTKTRKKRKKAEKSGIFKITLVRHAYCVIKTQIMFLGTVAMAVSPADGTDKSAPEGLCSIRHASTQDFDEQAELLNGWNQHYSQMSSGTFDGAISELRFDDIHLFMEYTSLPLFQSGKLQDHTIAIGIPLAAGGHGVFCGAINHGLSAHLFSGNAGFEFFSPSGLVMGGIVLPMAVLLDMLPEEAHGTLSRESGNAHLKPVGSRQMAAMREFIPEIFAMLRHCPTLLQGSRERRSLRKSILSNVTEILVDFSADDYNRLTHGKQWKIVAEAREYVRTNADDPISVAELCARLNVSRRTLQYCFQELLGMSPIAFLRTERLNGARRMLKQAHSVTEAAAAWGFWHFSHFAQDYRKMFGELPSDTFRRHARQPAASSGVGGRRQ